VLTHTRHCRDRRATQGGREISVFFVRRYTESFKYSFSVVQFAETSSLSCSDGSSTYPMGSSGISPTVCERCQCLANTLYAAAGQLTCGTIQCPATDCPSPSVPAGQCCPRCADECQSGVEITNCPASDVRKSLPANRNKLLYRFTPVARDCSGLGRSVTTSKQPPGDLYEWNGESGHRITVTASTSGGTSDTCTFKIIPVGKSSPFIVPCF